MARHTLQAYSVAVAKRRRPTERYNLGNLAGQDADFLDLLTARFASLSEPVKGQDRFARFDEVSSAGRTLRVAVSVGQYGTQGELFDVVANQKVLDVLPNHSNLVRVHNLLVIPAHGEFGLLLVEQYGGRGAYTAVKSQLTGALRDAFGDEVQLHTEVVANDALWQRMLERGQLESIAAVRYETQADVADPVKRRRVGMQRFERSGWRGFPLARTYLDRALGGESAGSLVGLTEPLDDAEVHATLRLGTQEKTFIIGAEKTPAVAMIWADDSDDRPDAEEFYTAASDVAPTLLGQLQVELPPDWRGLT